MAKAKKTSLQPTSQNISLIEGSDTPTFYSNYVECRVSNEEVILTFARRKYSDPEKQAEVLSRNYLTIPHFIRFSGLVLKQIKRMVELDILPKKVLKDISNELDSKKV